MAEVAWRNLGRAALMTSGAKPDDAQVTKRAELVA